MSIEDEFMRARANLGNIRTSSSTPNVSPNPAKRGNMSSSDIPPAGFRKMTDLEKLGKGIGDIGDAIQGWDPFGIGTFDENWQKTKDNWKTGKGSLGQGLKTLGSFLWSLPTGMASAPFSGLEKVFWEGIGGSPTSEATDEGWIPDYWDKDGGWDEAKQRLASTADGAIDLIGLAFGGTGRLIKGGARLAKGAGLAEAFTSKTGRQIMKETGEKWGTDAYKAASRAVTGRAIAGDMVEEGSEEFLQSLLGDVRGTKDQHGLDNDSLARALEAFGLGAAGGAVFSGVADFHRRMGERGEAKRSQRRDDLLEKARERAAAEMPDMASFTSLHEGFDRNTDKNYVSQGAWDKISDKMEKIAAKRRSVAGSFTATTAAPFDIKFSEIDISFEELKLGLLADFDTLKAAVDQRAAETAAATPGAQVPSDPIPVNDVAQNFGLSADQVVEFANIVTEKGDEAGLNWLNNIVKSRDVFVIVEKNPSFNRGPSVKKIRRVLAGQKQVVINPLEMSRERGDYDGDAITIWYGSSEVNKLSSAGARAASGYFTGSKFQEWAGITRATFWGNGGKKTSAIIKSIKEQVEKEWRAIAADAGFDPSICDVGKIIEEELNATEKLADPKKKAEFDDVFGKALQKIYDRVSTSLSSIYSDLEDGSEEFYRQRATAWRCSQVVVEEVLHLAAISESQRAAVTSFIAAATGGIEGYSRIDLENLDAKKILQDFVKDTNPKEYVPTEIDTAPDRALSLLQADNISESDAKMIMTVAGFFDPRVDESLKKANPIFRASGHFMMLSQGFDGIDINGQTRFWKNVFAGIVLTAMKINEFGTNAVTIAKSFIKKSVVSQMVKNFEAGKIFSGATSLDAAKEAFIRSYNEVSDAFNDAADKYIDTQAVVLDSLVSRSRPGKATDENWIGLFTDMFLDGTWSEVFDYHGEMADRTIRDTMEEAFDNEDAGILNTIAAGISDGNNRDALPFLLKMKDHLKYENVRNQSKLAESMMKDKSDRKKLLSRSGELVAELDDPKVSPQKKESNLHILKDDVDSLISIFGIDVCSALGWLSSRALVRSKLYHALINAQTEEQINNVIFIANVYANLKNLFVVGENSAQQGYFQMLSDENKTSEEKREIYWSMLNYLASMSSVSGVYADIFRNAWTRWQDCEINGAPIEVAITGFMKTMEGLLDIDVKFENKEKLSIFPGVYEQDKNGNDKLARGIAIESMATRTTSIKDIGINTRIERANQTSSAKRYTEMEHRKTSWNNWNEGITEAQMQTRETWIRTRLRMSVTSMSSSFLSSILRNAVGVPTREMAEKVKATAAQSLMYSAVRIANAPAFSTAMDQLAYNISDMSHKAEEIANNPILLARVLEDPTVVIPISRKDGLPDKVTGKEIWSWLLGRDFDKNEATFSDYNELFNKRPVLFDALLDKEIAGVKSGDLSTAQFIVDPNKDFFINGKLSNTMEEDLSGGSNLELKNAQNKVARALMSDKRFLVAFVYYLGDDILSISDQRTFARTVAKEWNNLVAQITWAIHSLNAREAQMAIRDIIEAGLGSTESGYVGDGTALVEFFRSIENRLVESEIDNIQGTISTLIPNGNEINQIIGGAFTEIEKAHREAVADMAIAYWFAAKQDEKKPEWKVTRGGRKTIDEASDDLGKAADRLANAEERFASRVEQNAERKIQTTENIANAVAADNLGDAIIEHFGTIMEFPHLFQSAMPEELKMSGGIASILDKPLSDAEIREAAKQNKIDNLSDEDIKAIRRADNDSAMRQLLAQEYASDVDQMWSILFIDLNVANEKLHSITWDSRPQNTTYRQNRLDEVHGEINRGMDSVRSLISKHLPPSFRSDRVLDSIIGRLDDLPTNTSKEEFNHAVSEIILEYLIRDIKASGELRAMNEQIALAGRNYIDGILSGLESARAEFPYGSVLSVPQPENLYGTGNRHSITSERVHLAANTLNDLLTGSDVSQRTGEEGNAFKTWAAFGLLPSYRMTGEGDSDYACSAPTRTISVLDFINDTDDIKQAVGMGLIRVDGQDKPLDYNEMMSAINNYNQEIANFQKSQEQPLNEGFAVLSSRDDPASVEELSQRILPQYTYVVHDARTCRCGACSNHSVSFAKRSLYEAASFASEELTIQARKRISFAASEIIKRIGKNPVRQLRGRVGEPEVRNCVFIVNDKFPAPNLSEQDSLSKYFGEWDADNQTAIQDELYYQVSQDPSVSDGWSNLSRANFFVAAMMTNFVTVEATSADGNISRFIFTRNEMLDGSAQKFLVDNKYDGIVQIQQHYQSLDQVARRILSHVSDKRNGRMSEGTWLKTDGDHDIWTARWAVESLLSAEDARMDNHDKTRDEIVRSFDELRPIPRRGEILTAFNPSLYSNMFYSILDGNEEKKSIPYDDFYSVDEGLSDKLDNGATVSRVFFASQEAYDGKIQNTQLQNDRNALRDAANRLVNKLRSKRLDRYVGDDVISAEKPMKIPTSGNIIIFIGEKDTVSLDIIKRISKQSNSTIRIGGSASAIANQWSQIREWGTFDTAATLDDGEIRISCKTIRDIEDSLFPGPSIPGAHVHYARQREDGTSKNLVTFSMLDQPVRLQTEEEASGFVGNIFNLMGDSAEAVFANSKVSATWSAPIKMSIPDKFNGFSFCDPSDFADETQRKSIVDNMWRNFEDANRSLGSQKYLYTKAFEDFVKRTDFSTTVIKDPQTCVGVIKKTINGVTEYYPIVPKRTSGTLVGATCVAPEKVDYDNAVSIGPLGTYEVGIDERGAVKLYNANLIYKAETAAGLGKGFFSLGDTVYDLEGVVQRAALDSRLLGEWKNLVTAITMWHLYQRHAIKKAAKENRDITIGGVLRNLVADPEKYASSFAQLENTGNVNATFASVADNALVSEIMMPKRPVAFKDFNGISGATIARIFQTIFVNCSRMGQNPVQFFNFTHEQSNKLSRERATEGFDSGIFVGLTEDDVHAFFNILDENGSFCTPDAVSIDQDKEVVRGGEVLCTIQLPTPVKGIGNTIRIRRKIFWPMSSGNGMATEKSTISNETHINYARNVALSLRYGVRNNYVDDLLDWALAENDSIVDDWVESWVSTESGIEEANSFGRYQDMYSRDELQNISDATQEQISVARAVRKWKSDSYTEELFSMLPLKITGMTDDEAFNFKVGLARQIPSINDSRYCIPVHLLDQIVRSISGTTKNKSDDSISLTRDEYQRCVNNAVRAIRDHRNPFLAQGQNYFSKSGTIRYGMGIAPVETIAWLARNTNWDPNHDVQACVDRCLEDAAKQKKLFRTITSKDRDLLRKALAIEKRINYLMYLNGKPVDEILCLGTISWDELSREDMQFYLEMNGYAEVGGSAESYEKFQALVDHTIEVMQAQQNRIVHSNTKSEDSSINGGTSLYFSDEAQTRGMTQVLRNAITIARAQSLLSLELPINAGLDKAIQYRIDLLFNRLAAEGRISPYSKKTIPIDRGVISRAAHDPRFNSFMNGLRQAQVNNMLPQFLAWVQDHDLFSNATWEDFIEEQMSGGKISQQIQKAYRSIARFATAEGICNSARNEIFIETLARIVANDPDDAGDLSVMIPTADGGTRTRLEADLYEDPVKAIANMFKPTSPHMQHARRAFNAAMRGDMAQDTIFSAFWNYIAQKHVGMDFIMVTLGAKFFRASTAFSMRVLNSIAPVSAIHYLITQAAINRQGWGKKIKALEGFQYEAEAVQVHASLKEAIAVDMAHMSMTAVAALLVCMAGGIEPPEDPDKWQNEDEWTVFGYRISANWWIKDILGFTIPLAITMKSALLGKPQFGTLFNSLIKSGAANPWLKIGDVVNAVFGEFGNNEEFESAVDLYSDYPGGAPNAIEYILGSKKAFGLSYLGQFITPSFVKELTRTLPQYEHTYNQIYAEDLTGSGSEATPRTQRTTFEDAQIRKVTRGNIFLGALMDLLPNDSNTGYMVQEMPRQWLTDPYQYKFMSDFNVRDANGNLKSDVEIQATCFEIVSMLASTNDMDYLYDQGFYLSYETKKYVSDLLSDLRVYAKSQFAQTTNETNGLDPYVLGFGSELLGKKTADDIVEGYNEFQQLMEDLYQKLWSDDLNQGLKYYNRYNTTWEQDSKGNWYATGYKEGLGSLFMPFLAAPTNDTVAGREGDWATISAVTGTGMYDEVGNGMRALIPFTLKEYGNKDEDGNVTYSDLYKLLWGKGGLGYGNDSSNGGSGGRSYSRGGYVQAPKIYNPSIPGTRYMDGPGRVGTTFRPISNVDLDAFYIRPGFETKGSRKAYRREDI